MSSANYNEASAIAALVEPPVLLWRNCARVSRSMNAGVRFDIVRPTGDHDVTQSLTARCVFADSRAQALDATQRADGSGNRHVLKVANLVVLPATPVTVGRDNNSF